MGTAFRRAAVIGAGLMGGSLAMALRRSPGAGEIAVYDRSAATGEKARELGAADVVAETASAAVEGADFVFIATPASSVAESFGEFRGALFPGTIVSDLASTKLRITREIEASLPGGVFYVGGHPMTGSEQCGIGSARPDLYEDAYYILTPTGGTAPEPYRKLHSLLNDLGARVLSMDPETHDRAMATISHVPHLASLALLEMAAGQRRNIKNLFTVAAGGFRDMTRIAASSPEIWADICAENGDFIVERLNEYAGRLSDIARMVREGDRRGLEEMFARARSARDELTGKPGRERAEMYEVSLPVPDEPGVLSRVTTAIGETGINIEDLSIVHPLEGETGIMTVKIIGRRQAGEVAEELSSLGYRASFWKARG